MPEQTPHSDSSCGCDACVAVRCSWTLADSDGSDGSRGSVDSSEESYSRLVPGSPRISHCDPKRLRGNGDQNKE